MSFPLSFEAVFVMFLLAGRYKADPRFAWVPVDLTVLFFGASVAYGLIILILRGPRLPRRSAAVVASGLLFAAYASVSLAWAPPEPFPSQKVLQFYTLCIWALAGPALVIAPERRRVVRFTAALLIMAAWIGYEAYGAYTLTANLQQVSALGGNYLGIGRTVGAGMLVAACVVLYAGPAWARFAGAAVFAGFGFIMLVVGGRGPLVATVAAMLVALFTGVRLSTARLLVIDRRMLLMLGLLATAGGGVYAYVAAGGTTTTLWRFAVLLQPGRGASAGARIDYQETAFALWEQRPVIGHGFGSWSALVGSPIAGDHPHNIVMEIGVELGFVGLLLFVGLLATCLRVFRSAVPLGADPLRILVLMLVISGLVNAQFSGNLLDNRTLFSFLGLMCVPAARGGAAGHRPGRPRRPARGTHLPGAAAGVHGVPAGLRGSDDATHPDYGTDRR